MVDQMNDFLGLKEAALFSGRSESTLKRLIIKVLEENKHDQSVIDQIIKRRPAAKGYYWFISKSFLTKEFELGGSVDDRGHSSERPQQNAGEPKDDHVVDQKNWESEIIAILKEQLRVKDEQIRNFQERDKEHNILLKTFQDKLFLLEEGRVKGDHVIYQEQTPDNEKEDGVGESGSGRAGTRWPEEATEDSGQATSEPDVWDEEEMFAPDEGETTAEEGIVEEGSGVMETIAGGAGGAGGEERTDAVPEVDGTADGVGVAEAEKTDGNDGAAEEEIREADAVAADGGESGGDAAEEGSEPTVVPAKKKGFWRRVFMG